MNRYEAQIRGGTCYVDEEDGQLEVGEMETIVDLIGGETYTVQYEDRVKGAPWLDTEPDGTLTFEVREAIDGMGFDEEFIDHLSNIDPEAVDEEGTAYRAEFFVDMLKQMWSADQALWAPDR